MDKEMNKFDYIRHLQELYHNEALRSHRRLHSDVQVEWAELKTLLQYAVAVQPLITVLEDLYYQTDDDKVKAQIVTVAEQVGFKESMKNIELVKIEDNCINCGQGITAPKFNNYHLSEFNVLLICNKCLLARQQEQIQEREQLAKYRYFVKEKGLENAFELYLIEKNFKP